VHRQPTPDRPETRNNVVPTHSREVVLGPSTGWVAPDLQELWHHRELVFYLAWRDLTVRYKQTIIGVAWVAIKPLATTIILWIIFGMLLRVPTNGLPYPVFAFAALAPWTFFSSALTQSGSSLVANAGLVTKVYFPRLALPLASVLAATVDFAVAFVILIVMMILFGVTPGIAIVTVPIFVLIIILAALGAGLWLSALEVRYRDVGYTIPLLMQLWMFVTPVIYPVTIIPEEWRLVYSLNPMVGVVEGFRWALLSTSDRPDTSLAISAIVVVVVLLGGLLFFRRTERTFADIV
jgi:lipopolysaccharide transport system permease protein